MKAMLSKSYGLDNFCYVISLRWLQSHASYVNAAIDRYNQRRTWMMDAGINFALKIAAKPLQISTLLLTA